MPTNYSAGLLDQLVTIKRASDASDDAGGSTRTWTDNGTHWAFIRPLRGNEIVQADGVQASQLYLVVLRSGADILPADVVVFEGQYLNVRAIRNTPRSAWLETECEAGVAP